MRLYLQKTHFLFILIFTTSIYAALGVNIDVDPFRITKLSSSSGLLTKHCTRAIIDNEGLVWFGTDNGLYKYDGYRCENINKNPNITEHIDIRDIQIDTDNNFWCATSNGLYHYNVSQNTLSRHMPADMTKQSIMDCIYLDNDSGLVYCGFRSGGLLIYNTKTEESKFIESIVKNDSITIIKDIEAGIDGVIWFGTWERGLVRYDKKNDEFNNFDVVSGTRLKTGQKNSVTSILCSSSGLLYAGTWGDGLYILDTSQEQPLILKHYNTSNSDITHDIIYCITNDENHNQWIGTPAGVTKIQQPLSSNPRFAHIPQLGKEIFSIAKSRNNVLWMCSIGNGIYKFYNKQPIIKKYCLPDKMSDLRMVSSISVEREDQIILGTRGDAMIIFDRKTKQFIPYTQSDKFRSLEKFRLNTVKDVYKDNDSILWIATRYNGLLKLYTDTNGKWQSRKATSKNVIPYLKFINKIYSKDGCTIWFTTQRGLVRSRLDKSGERVFSAIKLVHPNLSKPPHILDIHIDTNNYLWVSVENEGLFRSDTSITPDNTIKLQSISSEYGDKIYANDICETQKGEIFVATKSKGILRYNDKKNVVEAIESIAPYIKLYGLNCSNIVEDMTGNLWISSDIGLIMMVIKNGNYSIYRFDVTDGLPSNMLSSGCLKVLDNGEIVVGGDNGIAIFDPLKIDLGLDAPSTLLYINNQKYTSKLQNVNYPHNENNFDITFLCDDYRQPSNNAFAYKIDGANSEWVYIDASVQHKASLLNLGFGDYTFMAKSANRRGVWSDDIISFQFSIKQHPLKTPWAILAYICVVLVIISTFIYQRSKHILYEKMLALEKLDKEKQKKLFQYKLDFFTNLSHELLTPLSVINTSISQWDKLSQMKGVSVKNIINRNALSLYDKISNILYFRKVESNDVQLNIKQDNLSIYLDNIVDNFKLIALDKGINFEANYPPRFYGVFDNDKITTIVNNILSNAFKFTDSGAVTLTVKSIVEGQNTFAMIVISDTGCGMTQEKLSQLLNTHIRSEGDNGNSHIDFKLVQSLARMHHAVISGSSCLGEGSTFSVKIPFTLDYYTQHKDLDNEYLLEDDNFEITHPYRDNSVVTIKPNKEKKVILVNKNRDYLLLNSELIREYFTPTIFEDPQDAIKEIEREHYDLVVSDFIFESMSGIEFCNRLRESGKGRDIFFVLLIPEEEQEFRTIAYSNGVDSVLVKPVQTMTLLSRINSFLTRFKSGKSEAPIESQIVLTTQKEFFTVQIADIIEREINNSEFNVDLLAKELGMSNSSLYRKFKSTLDTTPNDYIRYIRMNRAAQILSRDRDINITEVAYMVGYNDSGYFGACFKKQFQTTPKEFQCSPNCIE